MIDRRKWLSGVVALGGAALGAILSVPALVAALSPAWKRREGEVWRSTGALEDFAVGRVQPAVVQVQRGDWSRSLDAKTVYVYRKTEVEVIVYSRNCTDVSCPLVFDPGSECFFCPCHGGIFGKEGNPMAGPPKVPLYRYANRVRDGQLEIDLYSLPPMT
jgi:menaquinol-cytochrome c reductase iron-sulfur subunit